MLENSTILDAGEATVLMGTSLGFQLSHCAIWQYQNGKEISEHKSIPGSLDSLAEIERGSYLDLDKRKEEDLPTENDTLLYRYAVRTWGALSIRNPTTQEDLSRRIQEYAEPLKKLIYILAKGNNQSERPIIEGLEETDTFLRKFRDIANIDIDIHLEYGNRY